MLETVVGRLFLLIQISMLRLGIKRAWGLGRKSRSFIGFEGPARGSVQSILGILGFRVWGLGFRV